MKCGWRSQQAYTPAIYRKIVLSLTNKKIISNSTKRQADFGKETKEEEEIE
jgi:hypothetical protein